MQELLQEKTDIEYIALVNRDFHSIQTVELGNTMILVAVWVEETRLIDNIWI